MMDGISRIGERLVGCCNRCEGVAVDLSQGVLPRCLFFEADGREKGAGCAIVGLNPGVAVASSGGSISRTARPMPKPWLAGTSTSTTIGTARLRHLANEMGFRGPILWCELVKCESGADVRYSPLQTFRTCADLYLTEELRLVPPERPIITANREAYRALAYLYPKRIVIGVPHPTGSFGQFGSCSAMASRAS